MSCALLVSCGGGDGGGGGGRLDIGNTTVRAEVMVPISELEHALPGGQGEAAFISYLLSHLGAEAADGAAWKVSVRAVSHQTYVDHEYLRAELELTPPHGASPRQFVLVNDTVTHKVRNHVVWVIDSGSNQLLGALQYPESRLAVGPAAR